MCGYCIEGMMLEYLVKAKRKIDNLNTLYPTTTS